ncbi:MAG TPA: alpha-amylase family glycosyl hydrolase, partial [Polyangiales bacterium]|nr:alpha-amylase family glycosyl hydrolase [Polyangiales bacterium]
MTTPTATYRLQLRPGFGFDQVAAIAPYLKTLGVSHVYLSPYLQAAPGSTHGYDVTDHSQVNRELGGAPAHARMVEALRAQGLGQVIDVVPNHMATSTPDNRFWWDLLEHGRCSRYANYFDVDFNPIETRLHDKVLVPILGDHYGRVIEAGEIRLERVAGRFRIIAHG